MCGIGLLGGQEVAFFSGIEKRTTGPFCPDRIKSKIAPPQRCVCGTIVVFVLANSFGKPCTELIVAISCGEDLPIEFGRWARNLR